MIKNMSGHHIDALDEDVTSSSLKDSFRPATQALPNIYTTRPRRPLDQARQVNEPLSREEAIEVGIIFLEQRLQLMQDRHEPTSALHNNVGR